MAIVPARIERALSLLDKPKPKQERSSLKCDPFSRGDFFHRVSTYTITSWFGKPGQLSPLACARFGWENISKDLIQCPVCKRQLVINPSGESNDEIEKFVSLLDDGHSELCPWRANPSPLTLADITVTNQEFYSELFNLLLKLKPTGVADLNLDAEFLGDFTCFSEEALQAVMVEARKQNYDISKDLLQHCCVVVLNGWSVADAQSLLKCSLCNRTLLFPPSRKFIPSKEHRPFCPWGQGNQIEVFRVTRELCARILLSPLTANSSSDQLSTLERVKKALGITS